VQKRLVAGAPRATLVAQRSRELDAVARVVLIEPRDRAGIRLTVRVLRWGRPDASTTTFTAGCATTP
jgi:hypothetical protein